MRNVINGWCVGLTGVVIAAFERDRSEIYVWRLLRNCNADMRAQARPVNSAVLRTVIYITVGAKCGTLFVAMYSIRRLVEQSRGTKTAEDAKASLRCRWLRLVWL